MAADGRDRRHAASLGWSLALVALVAVAVTVSIHPLPRLLLAQYAADWKALTALQRYQMEGALRASLLQGVAGLVLVIGATTALRQLTVARMQAEFAQRTQFVDAFTKAVTQLSDVAGATRVAGVYALTQLIETRRQDTAAIGEVLTRFIQTEGSKAVSAGAVEAALRCLSAHSVEGSPWQLAGAPLQGRNMAGLKLSGCDLSHADLREAKLMGSVLAGADLRSADLSRADLRGADLTGARLQGTRLLNIITDGSTKLDAADVSAARNA